MHDAAELEREHRSSIEVAKDAKGEYRWSLKRYYDETAPDADRRAIESLGVIDEHLRRTFGLPTRGSS